MGFPPEIFVGTPTSLSSYTHASGKPPLLNRIKYWDWSRDERSAGHFKSFGDNRFGIVCFGGRCSLGIESGWNNFGHSGWACSGTNKTRCGPRHWISDPRWYTSSATLTWSVDQCRILAIMSRRHLTERRIQNDSRTKIESIRARSEVVGKGWVASAQSYARARRQNKDDRPPKCTTKRDLPNSPRLRPILIGDLLN